MRKAGLSITAIALLLVSAALALQPAAAADAQVSAERIARHVEFLASDKLKGRRAGTPAADEAAKYIAAEMRSYGLKPAAPDFLQSFTFIAGVRLGKQNQFHIKSADRT